MRKLFSCLLIVFSLLPGCGRENEENEPFQPLVYHSLVAEKITLKAGETTRIKASANGSHLVYTWTATLGDILGSGAEVIYAPSICQIGKNTITCKISNDKNQSETKTVEITVTD